MALDKLKLAARQHEQREEWVLAIELYRQAIREGESGTEGGDPALFNRIGDLALKNADVPGATEAWEQAAIRYTEQGFFNNAIALCGKILRLDPDRVHVYLELARLQARKRVLYDVQHNLETYLARMAAAKKDAAAREQLEQFGRDFPGWRALDTLLDQLLGRDTTGTADAEAGERGAAQAADLVYIDTGPLTIERASEPGSTTPGEPATTVTADLELEPRPDAGEVAGFEPTIDRDAAGESGREAGSVEGLVSVERTVGEVAPTAMEGLERTADDDETPPQVAPVGGLETTASAEPPEDGPGTVGGEGVVFLDTATATPEGTAREFSLDDPLGNRVTAQALLEHGDRVGGIAALEAALAGYQASNEWLHAFQVASDLVQAEPRAIHRHQSRVEVASRMRDVPRLCEAYGDLADALLRDGSTEKAIAVFRRILELDEHNERARSALRAMAPESQSTAPEGFVDFGAMVIDDAGPRTTRMRTETPDVAPDEEDTFRDALAEFKRAIDQNLPMEDHQAHYDLGIAFKEMGLLDEAIGEFQKALRAPEVRLRTSEALGQVFFEQNRPAVAEAVLRGVERGPEGDAEKIGVLYWLGRALEAQGKRAEARHCYERVIAVDVAFGDAADRISHLTEGGGA